MRQGPIHITLVEERTTHNCIFVAFVSLGGSCGSGKVVTQRTFLKAELPKEYTNYEGRLICLADVYLCEQTFFILPTRPI